MSASALMLKQDLTQAGALDAALRRDLVAFVRKVFWTVSPGVPFLPNWQRALIRQMSVDNPLWGAPRIHGELVKLGFRAIQVEEPA